MVARMRLPASEERTPTMNRPHVSSGPTARRFRALQSSPGPRRDRVGSRSGRPRTIPHDMSKLRHRREQPLDVLRPRQPVVAVLDEREHDVVAREARGELYGVLPRNVGVLDPLEDAYRTAGLDHAAEKEMVAALLDQAARDQVGLVPIG